MAGTAHLTGQRGDNRSLGDHWLWEAPMLRAFGIATVGGAAVLCAALAPVAGFKALYALAFLAIAGGVWLVYGGVGKRAARIIDEAAKGEGTAAPALIVRGALQSPGAAIMGSGWLTLSPVVGEGIEIRTAEVESVRETRWFNGTLLSGKTGFWLTIPGRGPLGCAVPNSYAAEFRARLTPAAVEESQERSTNGAGEDHSD